MSYLPITTDSKGVTGADPGFVVKGGGSMRGVWGPYRVPDRNPCRERKLWGFEELQTFI